jgi:hypothetical protein
MELIIGRDASTSQLRITMGQQSKTFGVAGSVPMTVSRQHCSLTINPDGSYSNGSLKFEITAKRLYAASQRVL